MMNKTSLIIVFTALATYAAVVTYISYRYETLNDRLNLELGKCIGVNMRIKKGP